MTVTERETSATPGAMDLPPIYGTCPECGKPLLPREKETGRLRPPVANDAYRGRARCTGCGSLLQYRGDGEWETLGRIGIAPADVVSR